MNKKKLINIFVHLFLALLVIVWVLPIIWIILISFRGEQGAYTSTVLPKTYTINNYVRLFTETDMFNFPLWFRNTFIMLL